MFFPYFDRVAARATGDSRLVEVRKARRDFQDESGKFEDDEPWFEQRMALFLEWFVLDRPGEDGLTPAERFLVEEAPRLSAEEWASFEGLTCTQRALYRIDRWQVGRIHLSDLIGGGSFQVRQDEPMVGLERGDLLDARIVPFRDDLYLGRGMIFHPRSAREAIEGLVGEAAARGCLSYGLLGLLASMRLRYDRYRNVKVRQLYRLPAGWSPP